MINILRDNKLGLLKISLLSVLAAFFELLTLAIILPLLVAKTLGETITFGFDLKFLQWINSLDINTFIILAFILIVLRLIYFQVYYKIRADIVYNVIEEITFKQIEKIMQNPHNMLKQYGGSDFVRRVHNELLNFASFVIFPAVTLVAETMVVCILLTFLFTVYGTSFIFVAIIPLTIMIFTTYVISTRLKNISKARAKWDAEKCIKIEETVVISNDLRNNEMRKWWLSRLQVAFGKSFHAWKSYNSTVQMPKVSIESLIMITLLGISALIIGTDYDADNVSISSVSSFALISLKILPSLNRISQAIGNIRFGALIGIETGQFISFEPGANHSSVQSLSGIEIYDKQEQITYNINATGLVLLDGPSGSGKTFLIRDFLKIDNFERFETSLPDDTTVSYIPQNDHIFSGTLLENLSFGSPVDEVTQQKYLDLLSELDVDLKSLNLQSINDDISEKIPLWSGGQKKRIALVRALASDAHVLFLDEPFNGLHEDAARVALSLIFTLAKKKIIFISSHAFKDELSAQSSVCVVL